MKQLFISVVYTMSILMTVAQDSSHNLYFSLGTKHIGVCFGNARYYNGIKLNITDKYVHTINGIHLNLFITQATISNGLSVGLFGNTDSIHNGINLGIVGNNGIRNGVAWGGIYSSFYIVNGFAIAANLLGHKLNGLFLAVALKVGNINDSLIQNNYLNGIGISPIATLCDKVNGLTISIYNFSKIHNGLSIGLFNKANNLHGVQIGLLNYAGNNKHFFKWLPFLNMHFKK